MANDVDKLSVVIDSLWGMKVPTKKKMEGANYMVKHLMGDRYTPEAFNLLSNDQKAEAILTALKKTMMNMARSGGQIEAKSNLEQQVIDGGNVAINVFDPEG